MLQYLVVSCDQITEEILYLNATTGNNILVHRLYMFLFTFRIIKTMSIILCVPLDCPCITNWRALAHNHTNCIIWKKGTYRIL